jgi:hypothetical protein
MFGQSLVRKHGSTPGIVPERAYHMWRRIWDLRRNVKFRIHSVGQVHKSV